jgi:hypothetical protein
MGIKNRFFSTGFITSLAALADQNSLRIPRE